MSILVISMKNEISRMFAEKFAKVMNFNFVNMKELFARDILCTKSYPLNEAGSCWEKVEVDLINSLPRENSVIFIENDVFLSNNINLFKNFQKILIKCDNLDKINENLQTLIEKKVDFVLDIDSCNNIDINRLLRG